MNIKNKLKELWRDRRALYNAITAAELASAAILSVAAGVYVAAGLWPLAVVLALASVMLGVVAAMTTSLAKA